MISNILFNSETYQAFVDLVKSEMPHIIDIQPTCDTENPHQLFVYKGHPFQNKKQLVDGHSVVVPVEIFDGAEVHGGMAGVEAPAYFIAEGFEARIEKGPGAAGLGFDGNADLTTRGLVDFPASFGCEAKI